MTQIAFAFFGDFQTHSIVNVDDIFYKERKN